MPKDKTKRFMFSPYSNHADNPFTVYGIVTITPECAGRYLDLIDEVKALRVKYPDASVFKIEAFMSPVVWLEPAGSNANRVATDDEMLEIDDLVEKVDGLADNLTEITVSEAALLENVTPMCRMEMYKAEIFDNEVVFSGTIKHTAVTLASPLIDLNVLNKIAGRRSAKKAA